MRVLSELDLDRPLGGVDTGADHLAARAGHLARAQVADLAGLQLADAGVTDAFAASERERQAGVLAGDEDRLAAVRVRFAVALEELDRPALALLGLAEDRLEALHVQAVAVAVLVPVLVGRVEQLGRARDERLALLPVRTEILEVLGLEVALLARVLLVQAEALVALLHAAQLLAEDDVLGVARGVDEQHVVQRVLVLEAAQHAHDRRDAAARADEEQLLRDRVGEHELALDPAERDDAARPAAAHEVGRDGALVDVLDRDGDEAVGAAGVRGERVGPPVAAAVDVEPDAQVLAGPVALPLVAWPDRDRRG